MKLRRPTVVVLGIAFGVAACYTPPELPPVARPKSAPAPPTRTVDTVDDYFGVEVADPYRWLEAVDAPEVSDWVDAQNRHSASWLEQVEGREAIRVRLEQLWNFERWTSPEHRGGWWLWRHNDGLQNQGAAP